MPKPLPIVFLHVGFSPYLPHTIGQAKLRNLQSPVILLGNQATKKMLPFVTHVDMGAYSHKALEFQKIYRHLSPNGYPYELFCFLRWYVLRDFLKAHSLTDAFHLDSDVMLYADVNQEREVWRDWELTLVNEGQCAGNMFINGLKGLEDLCDLMWEMYTAADSVEKLTAIYQDRQKTGQGISDMVFLQRLYDTNRHRIGDMSGVQPDGSYWDSNIHVQEGFEMDGKRKRIYFKNYLPYGKHVASSAEIRFKSLHFQGAQGKPHIEPTWRQSCSEAAAQRKAA